MMFGTNMLTQTMGIGPCLGKTPTQLQHNALPPMNPILFSNKKYPFPKGTCERQKQLYNSKRLLIFSSSSINASYTHNYHQAIVENYVKKNRCPLYIAVLMIAVIRNSKTTINFSFLFCDWNFKNLRRLIHLWKGIFKAFQRYITSPPSFLNISW